MSEPKTGGLVKQPWGVADERLKKEMIERILSMSEATIADLKEIEGDFLKTFELVAKALDSLEERTRHFDARLRILELHVLPIGGGNA
jgi:hypothetical protein